MYIALQFTYYADIIFVPAYVGKKIKKIQRLFDKWLYDKDNDHENWIIRNGKKVAVSFDSGTFVDYINKYHLNDSTEKAYVAVKECKKVPSACNSTLFF